MKNTPDIYADNPVVSTEYIIAVMTAALAGKKVQARVVGAPWSFVPTPSWNWGNYNYRIDPSEKPTPPKIKVPFTRETFPNGVVWVRSVKTASTHLLVTIVTPDNVTLATGYIMTNGFLAEYYEYSLDRKTWFPCYTEVDAPETTAAPAATK